MAKPWKPKSSKFYSYTSVTGEIRTVTAGKDGVTEDLIVFLATEEHAEELQDRYQLENTDYDFLNAENMFRRHPNSYFGGDPLEQIADPHADIFNILFPNNTVNVSKREAMIRRLVKKLTPQQQELIFSLYYEQKILADFARDLNLTYSAAKSRRSKILVRLKRLITEESD